MKISGYSKEELQIIEDLLEASNVINEIYNNLYKLEIEDKQDSYDYQKLLTMLEEAIKIEKGKFDHANLDFEKCKKIYDLLHSSNSLLNLSNNDCIIYQKYDDKVLRRTMSILSEKIILDKSFQNGIITDNLINFFNSIGFNITSEEIYQQMNNNRQIQNAILNDMYTIILSIMTEYISNKEYTEYKNELVKSKYYISFINTSIESQMLARKFNVSNSTYISSNMTTGLLGINQVQYQLIRELEAINNVSIHIAELLIINDNDYKSPEKNIESIIRQCFIRALLTIMSKNSVYELKQNFHTLVESDRYLQTHKNDRISESAILSCFKCQESDRVKTRSVSFELPGQH